MSTAFKDGDDVIRILLGFQIENQRPKPDDPERGRGKNPALEARRGAIMQNFLRRSRGEAEIIGQFIEKPLNARR